MKSYSIEEVEADVILIGVGFGGFAALRALLERGVRVAAIEEYAWIGGQVSSQALCVLDEFHDPVAEEGIGYSRRYWEFREDLRAYYKTHFKLSEIGSSQLYFNPGNSMNSFMVAEPHVAHRVLRDRLHPFLESGQLILRCGWVAESTEMDTAGRRLLSVTARPVQGGPGRLRLKGRFFLDGTETGDLYPLIPVGFRLGADGPEFGERHAEPEADPECVQSSTVCFPVEYVPGGNFTIPRPNDYEKLKATYMPFMLSAPGATPREPSRMFRRQIGSAGRMVPPAFYYRSVIDVRNFDDPQMPYSRTIINASNDYHGEPMAGAPDPEQVYLRAKELSKAYLYWIQTEAPRDDGGFGYPELRLCPELTGTADGYAMAAYIREGRRLKAYQTIVEEDIAAYACPDSRARHFDDSVGLGGFVIDIHERCGGKRLFSGGVTTKPFQIPLASLLSPQIDNFAVAGKCIGTSQIANGAYRLHNVEWAVGEAAGELAAFCLERKVGQPRLTGRTLFDYQRVLVRAGVPIFWYDDFGFQHPAFEAVQLFSVKGIFPANRRHLRCDAQHSVARAAASITGFLDNLRQADVETEPLEEMVLTAHGTRKADVLYRFLHLLDRQGWPEELLEGNRPCAVQLNSEKDEIPAALA